MKNVLMSLPAPRPRNPFVAASLRRKAGAHRPGTGTQRSRHKAALRREIERLRPSP